MAADDAGKPSGLDSTLAEAHPTPPSPRAQAATFASSGASAPAELPTIRVEAYELGNEVARGGMGRIVSARDRRLGRTVAIKELHGDTEGLRVRFEREALITARLQHPAIVPVYEAGRWPSGEPFYAMKLVAGRSLKDVLADARTPAERLALLPHVLTVVDALAYAHGEGILHRDLKPANVLVGSFGETVVIDWGLAKDLHAGDDDEVERSLSGRPTSSEELTQAGSVLGTPAYMPPEQAAGLSVDERADVYALGAILYHVLAGQPPYAEHKSVARLLAAAAEGPPLPLAQHAPGLAPDLIAIVDKAMARDRQGRYPSARELAAELHRFQTGQLVASHHYTRWQLMARWLRRHRAVLVVVAGALAVLAAALTLSFQRIVSERDAARRARVTLQERNDQMTLAQARPLAESDPAAALAILATLPHDSSVWPSARVIAATAWSHGAPLKFRGQEGDLHELASSPDGQWLATGDDRGRVRLWDVRRRTSRLLDGAASTIMRMVFSPDSRQLAGTSQDGKVRLWDVATGREHDVGTHSGWSMDVGFSPDGTQLVSTGVDGRIVLWDVASGRARELADYDQWETAAAFSPDGHLLAEGGLDRPVHLWDVATGKRVRELAGIPGGVLQLRYSSDGQHIAASGQESVVHVWDADSGAHVELTGLSEVPRALAFSPDSKTVAASAPNDAIMLWDLGSGQRRQLAGGGTAGSTLAFSPDGGSLAAGMKNGDVLLWNLAEGNSRRVGTHSDTVQRVMFSRDGRQLISAGAKDRSVRIWPLVDPSTRVLAPGPRRPRTLALSADGKTAFVAGLDDKLWIWDTDSGTSRIVPESGWLLEVVLDHREQRVAVVSTDKALRLHDVVTRKSWTIDCAAARGVRFSADDQVLAAPAMDEPGVCLADASGATPPRMLHAGAFVDTMDLSPDGKMVAGSQPDGAIVLWTSDGHELRRLVGHHGEVSALAFSPAGDLLASGGEDGTLRLWSVATGESRDLTGGDSHTPQLALAWSPRGDELISAGHDRMLRRWQVASGVERPDAPHCVGVPRALAWSGDGSAFALATGGGDVQWWDAATGEGRVLHGSSADVTAMGLSWNGRRVAITSSDGTVRIWTDALPSGADALRVWLLQQALPFAAAAVSSARH